jgi:hypothetical protein
VCSVLQQLLVVVEQSRCGGSVAVLVQLGMLCATGMRVAERLAGSRQRACRPCHGFVHMAGRKGVFVESVAVSSRAYLGQQPGMLFTGGHRVGFFFNGGLNRSAGFCCCGCRRTQTFSNG